MPYSHYLSACRDQIEELRRSLPHEEIELLADYLAKDRGAEFGQWMKRNGAQVLAYVRSTPSQRAKKVKWQDPEQKRLLTYAAILHIESAEILLDVLTNTPLEPGGPYRDMAALAGEAHHDICYRREPEKWPFDE